MARMFGTDGVRGVAGEDLTAALAADIGRAASRVLTGETRHRPTVLIGRDTRESGKMLEDAAAKGLCEAGARVLLLGVVPTPAVAYLVTSMHADAGVMISASHNPYEYNGIKLFGADGCKLTDAQEDEIEALIKSGTAETVPGGEILPCNDAVDDYIDHLVRAYDGAYHGRVLVDCANGSASATARKVFDALGIDADIIFSSPDGRNINDCCGSTHIGALAERVTAGKYDVGLAFDGDADRLIAVDERGNVLDGDFLLAVLSQYLRAQNRLKNDTVVVTTMSNMGFFKLMQRRGISCAVTQVGDRYVLEEMRRAGHILGGEQSGHMIVLDLATTGDGQLSAILLLNAIAASGLPLSELAGEMKRYPQVQVNVKSTGDMKETWHDSPAVREAIAAGEARLGTNGRVLVRPSGTEPLLRIMVEGENEAEITLIAQNISEALYSAYYG